MATICKSSKRSKQVWRNIRTNAANEGEAKETVKTKKPKASHKSLEKKELDSSFFNKEGEKSKEKVGIGIVIVGIVVGHSKSIKDVLSGKKNSKTWQSFLGVLVWLKKT